jgi:hypothetical protein
VHPGGSWNEFSLFLRLAAQLALNSIATSAAWRPNCFRLIPGIDVSIFLRLGAQMAVDWFPGGHFHNFCGLPPKWFSTHFLGLIIRTSAAWRRNILNWFLDSVLVISATWRLILVNRSPGDYFRYFCSLASKYF